jgi:hypothetical protein
MGKQEISHKSEQAVKEAFDYINNSLSEEERQDNKKIAGIFASIVAEKFLPNIIAASEKRRKEEEEFYKKHLQKKG